MNDPTRPSVCVTRRLPAPVEQALTDRFAASLNRDDRPMDRAATAAVATKTADLTGLQDRLPTLQAAADSAARAVVTKQGEISTLNAEMDKQAMALAGLNTRITAKESEVLALVAQGRDNHEIARSLYLSVKTVQNHVSALLAKTGARTRAELVARARDVG